MDNRKKRFWIKAGSAALAFVPMAVFFFSAFLNSTGFLPAELGHKIVVICGMFNFPAFSLLTVVKTYHASKTVELAFLIIFMLAWSSFIAWLFWRVAGTFMGEDEPEFDTDPARAKFDWEGFRVRFFFGFIIGFLCGFRFVKNTHSMQTVVIASIISGTIGGFLLGLSRPNFWSRP